MHSGTSTRHLLINAFDKTNHCHQNSICLSVTKSQSVQNIIKPYVHLRLWSREQKCLRKIGQSYYKIFLDTSRPRFGMQSCTYCLQVLTYCFATSSFPIYNVIMPWTEDLQSHASLGGHGLDAKKVDFGDQNVAVFVVCNNSVRPQLCTLPLAAMSCLWHFLDLSSDFFHISRHFLPQLTWVLSQYVEENAIHFRVKSLKFIACFLYYSLLLWNFCWLKNHIFWHGHESQYQV